MTALNRPLPGTQTNHGKWREYRNDEMTPWVLDDITLPSHRIKKQRHVDWKFLVKWQTGLHCSTSNAKRSFHILKGVKVAEAQSRPMGVRASQRDYGEHEHKKVREIWAKSVPPIRLTAPHQGTNKISLAEHQLPAPVLPNTSSDKTLDIHLPPSTTNIWEKVPLTSGQVTSQ